MGNTLITNNRLIKFSTRIYQNSCVYRLRPILRTKRGSGHTGTPKKERWRVSECGVNWISLCDYLFRTLTTNYSALNLRYVTEFKAFLIRLVLMFYQRSLHPKYLLSFIVHHTRTLTSSTIIVVVGVLFFGCAI